MTDALDPAAGFDLSAADAAGLSHAYDAVCRHAGLRSWVDERVGDLRSVMGEATPQPRVQELLAVLPDADPAVRHYLPLVVLARAVPALQRFAGERDIPSSVLTATLADVGRTLRKNLAWFGHPGLGEELSGWLARHLHGALFQLGRLQLERVRLGATTTEVIRAAGRPAQEGELVLSLHIPSGLGAMTPQACDASLALARSFFARHFPGEQPRYGVCLSWLLDEQLRDYLAPGSNILRFQDRFAITPMGSSGGDADIATRRFVFGEAITPLDEQPRRSSLERGVHAHLESGRHFRHGRGWFVL